MGVLVKRLAKGVSSEFIRLGKGSSDEERLFSGLVATNLLKEGEILISYQDCNDWQQGGGETYIADCIIGYQSNKEEICSRHVIAKALISMALSPERMLQTWLRRRLFLKEKGVRVVELYWADDGIILEEFLEGSVQLDRIPDYILQQIAAIAYILDKCGFVTLSFLSDLRIKGDDLYYVDFGFDLGEPGNNMTNNARQTIETKLVDPYKSHCLKLYDSASETIP